MLRPYLKIWDWDWIFGRAVKAISSLGVRSPCYICTRAALLYRVQKKYMTSHVSLEKRGPLKTLNDTKLVLCKWCWGHSHSFRTNLVSYRAFKSPLFPKPVYGQVLFLDTLKQSDYGYISTKTTSLFELAGTPKAFTSITAKYEIFYHQTTESMD